MKGFGGVGMKAMGVGGGGGLAAGRGPLGHAGTDDEDERELSPLSMKLIGRLLRYTRPYARTRNALFALTFIRALQLNALPAILTWTITGPIADKNLSGTVVGTALFAAVALITQITFHFRHRLSQQLGESVVHDLRNQVFTHLQGMNMGFFGRTKLGRIISRFTSDIDSVRSGVQEVLFVGIVQVTQMLGAAALMFYYDWKLFLLLLAMAPVLYAINAYFRKKLSDAYRIIQESFSRVTSTLAESVSGIRVTQSFVRQDVNSELFHEMLENHGEYNMVAARTTGAFQPLLEFNSQVFYAALLITAGWLVFHGSGTHAEHQDQARALVGFFFQATLFFGPVQHIGQLYNQALISMAGCERVFRLLDSQPDWVDPEDAVELPPITGRVEFRDVAFEYVPGKGVLEDVDFVIEPGQNVAFVGHTGSGKTTIINLISKFYLPTRGRILIDGHDLTRVQTKSLHHQMGIVLQVNFLFSGSVMDNIRVGREGATDADVIDAARKLDVLDLLESLPEGFATSVGEGGRNMSLGQRQIICFTRAMLADPRIMILDEATSSVDTMTEARIQKALAILLKDRTSFIIAHRLSTIRHADMVMVLDHGRIIERGNHVQLLATGGVYANLYRQFIRASEA